jgi:redox-sensitive bicupin YhaK (pirin superfamily)
MSFNISHIFFFIVSGIATAPLYLDIQLPANYGTFTHPVDPEHNVFCYVIEGEAKFASVGIKKSTLVSKC